MNSGAHTAVLPKAEDGRDKRPTLLFSPCYAEPVKAMLPHMHAAAETFDVFVLNTVSWVDDRVKSERALQLAGFSFASVEEWSEALDIHPLLRILRSLDLRARRVSGGILAEAIFNYASESRWRRISRDWLDRLRPAALVIAGEQNPIQKHLIDECNRRNIPSVILQWGIANASERHTREMLERASKRERMLNPLPARLRKRMAASLSKAALSLAGIRVRMPSNIFGGGHATVFAVIGPACYDNYVQMGVPPRKMTVIGHPPYEELYRSAQRLTTGTAARNELCAQFGFDPSRELIVWCTNDQRGYYAGFRSYSEMLNSWRSKLKVLLELTPHTILIKLHPKEHLSDYSPLVDMSERVHIMCDESGAPSGPPRGGHPRVHILDFEVRRILPHASLVVTRFSGTATDALCLGRRVITHNAPPIPGGTLYEDLEATIHANSDEDFAAAVHGVVVDGSLGALAERRRQVFLSRYLRLDAEAATQRFCTLMKELTLINVVQQRPTSVDSASTNRAFA